MNEPTLLKPGGWVRVDALGGISGDMFTAAAVDAWPTLESRISEALHSLALPFQLEPAWARVTRRGIAARQVVFSTQEGRGHPTGAVADIRQLLLDSDLSESEKVHATGILRAIAEAEGQVHRKPPDDVHLHELADWDSIADIIAAAAIIAAVGEARWICPVLPLGKGRIQCAHGPLPVPAPATAILCNGATFVDDGIGGERVTPTGAAILAYLNAFLVPSPPMGKLVAAGYGAGSRDIREVPNVLRLLFMQPCDEELALHDEIVVLRFDVDDQSPEDLAIGLDRIRGHSGVLSVVNAPAVGKRGRQVASIEILAQNCAAEEVLSACFRETTTLGVRVRTESRRLLRREEMQIDRGIHGVAPVKRAFHADGAVSCKVEARYLESSDLDRMGRESLRRAFELPAHDGVPEGETPAGSTLR